MITQSKPANERVPVRENDSEGDAKRLTVKLGPEAVAALDRISDGGTKSYTEIIRGAIWLEERVHSLLKAGGELYFRTPEGELQMIVLR